ncbi:MAG TPA: diguanylate cyclase [Acidimicrobiales bacterium]|jgi:diguanylate cyclase (GGDEF)-like protein/PAS domain S-box-containing protein
MPAEHPEPSPEHVRRRLTRERLARREAEAIAEKVTGQLYDAVNELQRTTAVVDETTDFVAITDANGRARYLNRAMAELLGIEQDDDPDVTFVDLLTGASRERFRLEALPTVEEKGVWRGELVLVPPGGRAEIPVSQVLVGHRGPEGTIDSMSSISRDITDRVAVEQQLTHLALHDQLTQLPNRRLFFDRLDIALARAARLSTPIGVLFIDLDRFKPINDDLGHRVGDDVLAMTAQRLTSAMRPGDTVARIGGDEFAVLCESVPNEQEAAVIADRLRHQIALPMVTDEGEISISASIGVVITAQTPAEGPERLLREADAAMYTAKRSGGGGYHVTRWDNAVTTTDPVTQTPWNVEPGTA